LGIPSVTLTCETDMVRVAKNKQLLNATAPIVALSAAVAAAGFAGITRAIVVGFIVSVVRWAMVEAYGTWRAWYRARVPVQVMLRFPHYSEDANERISAK
jgi:cytochrome c-type biogenesis protein CcmH/NrfG